MAHDILFIPVSTMASESAFSVGGRVFDLYRSALKPSTVEALVCCRNWLYGKRDNKLKAMYLISYLFLYFISL